MQNHEKFFEVSGSITDRLRAIVVRHNETQDPSERLVAEAEYMQAIIDADNVQALKFAIGFGMVQGGNRDEEPDSVWPIYNAVEKLAEEDPTYHEKFSTLLAKLLDPKELHQVTPEEYAAMRYVDQIAFESYAQRLLTIAALQPPSAALFESIYTLVTADEQHIPNMYIENSKQGKIYRDIINHDLWRALATQQTDNRLHKTWQAALREEPSGDPDNLYPHRVYVNPFVALVNIARMPHEKGQSRMPDQLIVSTVNGMLFSQDRTPEKPADKTEYYQQALEALVRNLGTEDAQATKNVIRAQFGSNSILMKAMDAMRS